MITRLTKKFGFEKVFQDSFRKKYKIPTLAGRQKLYFPLTYIHVDLKSFHITEAINYRTNLIFQ
jgi:hypothetical protein